MGRPCPKVTDTRTQSRDIISLYTTDAIPEYMDRLNFPKDMDRIAAYTAVLL